MQRAKKSFYVIAAIFATSVLGGVAAAEDQPSQQQAPTQVMATRATGSATVEKVDMKNRQLTLTNDQGTDFKVDVPKSVTRFESIKKGDKISIDYYSAIALALNKNDQSAPSEGTTTMKERVPGPLPGGLVAHKISATAEVMSVDKASNKLTIKGPDGDLDTIDVRDPTMQADLAKLKQGDKIRATYMEAVAITMTPQ